MKTEERDPMVEARKVCVLSHPWWGALALRLNIQEDPNIEKACTDGVTLRYNKTWFETLTPQEREAVVAHETEHCALGHPWRIGSRDMETANVAADHVVNLDLAAAGFHVPQPHYADPKFSGMSFEKVYAILYKEKLLREEAQQKTKNQEQPDPGSDSSSGRGESPNPKVKTAPKAPEEAKNNGSSSPKAEKQPDNPAQPSADGSKNAPGTVQGSNSGGLEEAKPGDPANWGGIEPAPEPEANEDASPARDVEHEWEVAVETASLVATKAGDMPGSLQRTVTAAREPKEDLAEVLQQYLTSFGGYSYSNPNRRMLHRGIRLPGRTRSKLSDVVIFVDTSGSVSGRLLAYFQEKANEILMMEESPEKIYIGYCDTTVKKVEEITDGQLHFDPIGGGGTSFQPAFDWVEKEGIQPSLFIYLTDMEGPAPKAPDYPVLWVVPIQTRCVNPWFGELVRVDPYNN